MLDIQCLLPVFGKEKGMLRGGQREITLSLREERTTCIVTLADSLDDGNGSFRVDLLVPYEYDSQRKILFISTPDYTGKKCFQILCSRNGEQVNVSDSGRSQEIEAGTREAAREIYGRLLKKAEEENFSVFVRDDWDEERGRKLGIEHLRSVYGGWFICEKGTYFWNVIGSSQDEKIDNDSWIQVLNDYVAEEIRKGNINLSLPSYCIAEVEAEVPCRRTDLVGGHVVFNQNHVRPGKNPRHGIVGLLPICKGHNHYRNDKMMRTAERCPGIWLDEYTGKY